MFSVKITYLPTFSEGERYINKHMSSSILNNKTGLRKYNCVTLSSKLYSKARGKGPYYIIDKKKKKHLNLRLEKKICKFSLSHLY